MGILLILTTVSVLVVWAVGESSFRYPEPIENDTLEWAVVALAAFLASYVLIHIFIHEIGHLLAALVLRMPLLGFRVGPVQLGLEKHIEGTGGHVMVDISRMSRAVPARIVLMTLAGPLFELALAPFVLQAVGDTTDPVWFRAAALGLTVALVHGAVENLSPVPPLRGVVNDGLSAFRWITAPARQGAEVQLQIDLALLHAGSPQLDGGVDRRTHVRSLVADPRPEIASAAITELFRSRARGDDGWADVDVVSGFVARRDVPGDERAAIGGNYALSLALLQAATRRSLDTIPASPAPVPDRIVQLAEAAREAHAESLQARAALGLARIMQGRPKDAQSVLIDVDTPDADGVRARAMAVRAIAEDQLNDSRSAMRLLVAARQLAPEDAVVKLAGRVLAPVD